MNIQTDLGYPRFAAMLWVDDGSCRQLVLTGQQRKAVVDMIVRMHNFDIRVSDVKLPLKWPEPKAVEYANAETILEHE